MESLGGIYEEAWLFPLPEIPFNKMNKIINYILRLGSYKIILLQISQHFSNIVLKKIEAPIHLLQFIADFSAISSTGF